MALGKWQLYYVSLFKNYSSTSNISGCSFKTYCSDSILQPPSTRSASASIKSLSASSSSTSTFRSNSQTCTNLVINSCHKRFYARLSPNEVTTIIRANESTQDINVNSIKSFDTNQLNSNTPIEDTKAEARCLLTTGMLFGVFDGHGGPACAQVVAKRVFNYIAAALLPTDTVHKLLNPNLQSAEIPLLEIYHDHFDLVQDLQQLYCLSFDKYLQDLVKCDQTDFLMRTVLEKVFVRLDADLSREATEDGLLAAALSSVKAKGDGDAKLKKTDVDDKELVGSLHRKTLSVAEAGAVCCLAHIDGEHLHVASTGDCQAVIGVRGQGETTWVATPLTKPHNSDNLDEVQRLYSEHPPEERDKIIQNDRLLGHLAPLRAFGDFRFKWTKDIIRQKLSPYLGDQAIIQHSITPPYLTALPEVTYHKLRPQDRFLILGTDGLWDFLTPSQAVRLVGEHMSGKTILSPFTLPDATKEAISLGVIHEALMSRAQSFKVKPIDSNAATHLIRHALGTTEYGVDHHRIAHFLTLPKDSVRLFRDDITIQVIFFDSDYLRQRPL